MCSPGYLEKRGPFREPADLKRATLLRTSRPFPWRPWFRRAGLDWEEPAHGPIFGEVPLLLDAAANGAGVALAGPVAAGPWLSTGRLVRALDIGVPHPGSYYAVCWLQLERPEVNLVMEWLASSAREEMPADSFGPAPRLEEGIRPAG